MKLPRLLKATVMAAILVCSSSSFAQTIITWKTTDGDFFDINNWDTGTVPKAQEIAVINSGKTATIAATTGTFDLGSIHLGDVEGGTESGHVIMNGGHMTLGANAGDPKAVIGLSATLSTFIMNGGEIFFDGPELFPGDKHHAGVNNLDWEVGEKGLGRFEMHSNAVFRAGDDLKIAENAAGNGSCLIDGNAVATIGSGISISAGGEVEQSMVVAGNARIDVGNSMGGGSPQGSTDEGYLTMATGNGHARLTIQDNAVMNIRRLTARDGTSIITVKDHGQFNIFDVFAGKGGALADRPAETEFNSSYGTAASSVATLTLQDDAVMTVNAGVAQTEDPYSGLTIGGRRGTGDAGGQATLLVRDRASLRVEQDLALGDGAADTSNGTLQIAGSDAKVSIGGDLNLAYHAPTTEATPGIGTLNPVITGLSNATINVSGTARITNGSLKVTLSGYKPVGGEIYTLIKGGTIDGQFKATDFTEAPLVAGLQWSVEYAADKTLLKVTGTPAGPRIVTVTTTNNATPAAGEVSLLQALSGLQDGDEIRFNIAGAGPHVIATPVGGYPVITQNNVTIDGYSQPGSSPNTNPILAANNAKIDIVLDSRNGNSRLLDFAPTGPTDQTGYGDTESAVIGILQATNVQVRGVDILAVPLLPGLNGTFGDDDDIRVYGVSFAKAASGHVDGCWIGVAPDGTTIAGPASGITGFRYRVRDENSQVLEDILINDVVVGVKAGAANPRSEFNVIVGIPGIPIGIEGNGTRISGNFLNVMPDGLHDFNPPLVNPTLFRDTFEGNIEIGRGGNNTLIGTDGDGVNDADERNVFSGVVPPSQGGYEHNIEFYGQNPGTNIVVAGNYIGVGVDGTTRFTNGVPALNAAGGTAQFRFGSDFDGVSDAVEANVVYNNWPFDLFPVSDFVGDKVNFFDEISAGASVSFRGNTLVNNFPEPASPAKAGGQFLLDYYAKALADTSRGVVPVVSTNSSLTKLIGTVPIASTNYPVTIIDVYLADPVGITNGMAANIPELTNGFVQGQTYLGSYVVDSANDLNPAPGAFEFDTSNLNFGGGTITITANYSKDPPGTHNGQVLTSPFSDPLTIAFVPGGVTSVGLTSVVRDRTIFDTNSVPNLDNWEPYASVLGTNTFLVEANTFAEGSTDNQRFGLAFQPVGDGNNKPGDVFFADNGTPFRGAINASRQNGNPGRVAGDRRPGAVNFITGAEGSPHTLAEFQSDNRWKLGLDRLSDGRYGTVQTFSLDPTTLAQTPKSKAFDAANGRLSSGTVDGNQVTRFGGDLTALDNGNFVAVVEDRSKLRNPDGDAVVAVIVAPDGSIVKDSFVVANGDIWANAVAYKGGFAVRVNGLIYFYDNGGNLKGTSDQDTATGANFDRGRGDGTRMAGHINSPYVYLAGKPTDAQAAQIAVWDSRDQSFVALADVSESGLIATFDRVNLDVDALDRVAVAYEVKLPDFEQVQTLVRVLAFDGASKSFSYLTKSFFPFVNYGAVGIRTIRPTVAMTTKEILIAAKGEINSTNSPTAGVNTLSQTTFYTVVSHPDPKDDPTTPVSGQPPAGLTIHSITPLSNAVTLSWSGGTAPYLVQMKASLSDTNWFNVLTTSAQSATVARVGATAFFRVGDHATTVVIPLTAQLSGAGEVPAVATPGIGLGAFSLEGDTLTYLISFSGLSGNATASHIHGPAEVTGTAPVIIPFTVSATPSGTISGSATVTPEQKTNLLSGKTYANIHTGAHPGGEIRGQVNLAQFTAKLSGNSEVPAVSTPATGDGAFALIGNQLFYNITFTGLSGNATASHIHGPADIGGTAPVIIPFTVSANTSGTISGSVTVTPDQLANLVSGKTYANIHTAAHPGGEIRGQLVTLLLKATLSGSAEVPAVSTSASGTGVFALTGNQLNYTINYSGLSGDATASHIHGPADVTGTAPVIIPFAVSAGTSGTIAGTVAVTSDQFTYLLTGRTYANIHTAANPGGEIRGQITP